MIDALWYFGRGTGFVAVLLLTVVMVLGIGTRSGRPLIGLPRFGVALVHRNAALLAVAFLAIHVVTLWLDPYAELHAVDVVLPFVGTYRPFWLGLGTVALDLMAALVATSLLRHRLGLRTWRTIHWAAYGAWPVAIAHTVGTGTDALSPWALGVVALCVAAVTAAIIWRRRDTFVEATGARRRATPRPARGPVTVDGQR